jgi:hypothetical protein
MSHEVSSAVCGRVRVVHAERTAFSSHLLISNRFSPHCFFPRGFEAREERPHGVFDTQPAGCAGDGYVHRLVQSSTGKVVELGEPNPFASLGQRLSCSEELGESAAALVRDPDKEEAIVASKLDAMAFEYNQV